MVASLVYRTTDLTKWGNGQGSDLTATTIDTDFWTLFSAVQSLENANAAGAGIDFITQPTGGNQFYVHLTDHRVLGPFIIPTAQWNPRGQWAAVTNYALYDTVAQNGSLYLVITPHTSHATFSPFATDGLGHDLYALLLEQPADELPVGGTIHQRLVKASGSPFATEWLSDTRLLCLFVEGKPNPGELLFQFVVTDDMLLPVGLTGSGFYANTPTGTNVSYTLNLNGSAIGSITFTGPSPHSVVVSFASNLPLVPGDVISLIAPSVPDNAQADISFTIVAVLT